MNEKEKGMPVKWLVVVPVAVLLWKEIENVIIVIEIGIVIVMQDVLVVEIVKENVIGLSHVHENEKDVEAGTVLEMWIMMKLKKFLFLNLEIKIVIVKEKESVVALGTVNVRRIVKIEIIIAGTKAKIAVINMIKTILNETKKFTLNKSLLMIMIIMTTTTNMIIITVPMKNMIQIWLKKKNLMKTALMVAVIVVLIIQNQNMAKTVLMKMDKKKIMMNNVFIILFFFYAFRSQL